MRLSLYALSTIARSLANWSELAVIDPSSAQKVITAYLPIPIGGPSERLPQYSCMDSTKYKPSLINSFELGGYIRGCIFEDTYEHHFGQQLDPNFGTICEQKTPF